VTVCLPLCLIAWLSNVRTSERLHSLVPTHVPHYREIFFHYGNTLFCLAVIRSVKHKHMSKNWTYKAQKHLLKLDVVKLAALENQLPKVC
jgi:hypothetical protein